MKNFEIEDLLTPKEVRQIFKLSLPAVCKTAERGDLPCVRWECMGDGQEMPRATLRFYENEKGESIGSDSPSDIGI